VEAWLQASVKRPKPTPQAVGADLVVLDGDLTAHPSDIRKVSTVFRRGIGHDPALLSTAVHGLVGLR
jgi:hypothetical protein